MALGERIQACRLSAGMSQEKVAELVGVSRQAVTKWETNRSAPNTENLFKLAEIFGTTVDMLLASGEESKQSQAEQIYRLYKQAAEKEAALKKQKVRKNLLTALLVVLTYLALYLIGRVIWCDMPRSNVIGWLVSVIPSGQHSYLYGWLLSSRLFWGAMGVSAIPALWGKYRFSWVTLLGFVIGFAAGMLFGPNPAGTALGQDHYGWAIWGAIYLVSAAVGIAVEKYQKKRPSERGSAEE